MSSLYRKKVGLLKYSKFVWFVQKYNGEKKTNWYLLPKIE